MTAELHRYETRRCDDGLVDDVLVERVLAGKADPALLNDEERIAAAGAVYRRTGSCAAVERALKVSGAIAGRLVFIFEDRERRQRWADAQ
jgi:hypothetical protein